VSGVIVPAVVAAGGGGALLGGIYAYERKRDAAMRTSRVRVGLLFPAGLEPSAAAAALAALSGLRHTSELILETTALESGIRHGVLVPKRDRAAMTSALSGAIPGVRFVEGAEPVPGRVTLALRIFVATPALLSTDHPADAARSLLGGLSAVSDPEAVVIRWAVAGGGPRRWEPASEPSSRKRQIARGWRQKTTGAGLSASGLVLVRAESVARARELASQVESLLRSRRTSPDALRITSERGNRSLASLPRVGRSSGWLTPAELLPLLAWPIGSEPIPGVEVGRRELRAGRSLPRDGHRVLVARDAGSGRARPVAISATAATRHVAIFGRSGAGKTSLLGNLTLSALAAGYGGIVAEPKDLSGELLDRVPAEHAHRVIPISLSQVGPAIGLDLFGGGDPYLRSDAILSALRSISDGWGPRIEQHLRLGLTTLAALPEPALADWLRLYRDPGLRREALARLHDPFIASEWRTFEALSPAEQFQHTIPAISRLANLLSRPALRATLSQRDPKLNVADVLERGHWLVVSLNPSASGEPAARLLGAVVLFLAWSAIEGRVAVRAAKRRPLMLVLDELQALASLPVGFEAFFERARSTNTAVVAASQTTARLDDSLRTALLGNVGSLVSFNAGADEAARLARELPGLDAADLMALGRFEVGARIATSGAGAASAVITGRTQPLPKPTGQADRIRALAQSRYGRDREEIERKLAQPPGDSRPDAQIGSRRRTA
jgi:hypothetical protein